MYEVEIYIAPRRSPSHVSVRASDNHACRNNNSNSSNVRGCYGTERRGSRQRPERTRY